MRLLPSMLMMTMTLMPVKHLLKLILQTFSDGLIQMGSFSTWEIGNLLKTGDQSPFLTWIIKAISVRLSKGLEFIVNSDQTCSFPRQKISSNLHTLRDILDYIDRTGETGILVSVDQEKAFNRVNHTCLRTF